MKRIHLIRAFVLCACLSITTTDSSAQDAGTLVADGLHGPMGVLVAPDGGLYVIDSGTGGDVRVEGINPMTRRPADIVVGETARVLLIEADGRQTLVANLPSMMVDSTMLFGGGRLAMLDGTLYATSGEWGEEAPPERPPFSAAIVRIADGERTEIANTWDLERDENPDGTLRETNPYGLTVGPDGKLWVADAAGNTLLRVDPNSGDLEVVAVFEGLPSPMPSATRNGARISDPVPTAVAFEEDGTALVSLLPGFPILPDSGKVVRVTADGKITPFAENLTAVTDLRRGPDGELYAVSFGRMTPEGPAPNTGAIVRVREGRSSDIVVSGLSAPTSVDFNAAGDAFVTVNGGGPPGAGEVRLFEGIAAPK